MFGDQHDTLTWRASNPGGVAGPPSVECQAMRRWLPRLFSREDLIALLLCLLIIALLVMSAERAPEWIYQGF